MGKITLAHLKSFTQVKADVKYQVNPNSVSFKDMEVVGFVRDTAEIWNYNTNNKNWELFNAGQNCTLMEKLPLNLIKKDMVC